MCATIACCARLRCPRSATVCQMRPLPRRVATPAPSACFRSGSADSAWRARVADNALGGAGAGADEAAATASRRGVRRLARCRCSSSALSLRSADCGFIARCRQAATGCLRGICDGRSRRSPAPREPLVRTHGGPGGPVVFASDLRRDAAQRARCGAIVSTRPMALAGCGRSRARRRWRRGRGRATVETRPLRRRQLRFPWQRHPDRRDDQLAATGTSQVQVATRWLRASPGR